jgi:hypothetical protein
MSVTLSYIGNCFVGSGRGYIYILYTKVHHSLYVGQTNGRTGVIGRLCAHVSSDGTFRMRLLEREGIDLDEVGDLHVFSYCLPRDPRYIGIDRTYREGVEYLVQKHLHTVRGRLRPYMRIVSHVEYNDTAKFTFVAATAKEIISKFLEQFSAMELLSEIL